MKIGVVLESFRLPIEQAAAEASAMGIEGVQVYGTMGEWNADFLTEEKIRAARKLLETYRLELSAVCGDIGCAPFYDPDANRQGIDRLKRILSSAVLLGTKAVTTHIGVVPEDEDSPRYQNMQRACRELAEHADKLRAHFAVETGPEPADRLKRFLDKLDSKGVAVNLDPANLVMAAGDDPVKAVRTLREYIVHTHAKDGVMLKQTDTRYIYDASHDGLTPVVCDEYFREVPLGKGGVDFTGYLSALADIGYNGYLTVEREVGENPSEDIFAASEFLKEKLRHIKL